MTTFGNGDYGGYNDWVFSGANSFFTSWDNGIYSTGVLGRITSIAARWDGNGSAPTGHNGVYQSTSPFTRQALTNTFTATNRTAGTTATMHNVATTADLWQSNASYFIGFSRDSSLTSFFSFKDGGGGSGGYAGKSATDGNINGGTNNWGGVANPGGLPVFGTVTDTNIYVRRSGAWTKTFVYVRRSGAWTGPVLVYVRRSGAWTLLNELKQHEIPKNGEGALVDIGKGLERGWIVEEGERSWFGNVDPTTQSWDWTQEGHYEWEWGKWTGRFNSHEPEEIAYARLEAVYNRDQAIKSGNFEEIKRWTNIPLVKKLPDPDPEPILLDCNCGG